MNKLLIYLGVLSGIVLFSSCYNNKKDISTPTATSLASISFRDDIVPIVISGACGCHNNGQSGNAIQFTHFDTVFYSTILARAGSADISRDNRNSDSLFESAFIATSVILFISDSTMPIIISSRSAKWL